MKLIPSITSDPNQTISITLDDGSKINMVIVYKENQSGWFYSVVWGSITLFNNKRIVSSPNMLRSLRGIIPFGIACTTTDGYEPVFKDDFSNGRASIYILNTTDVTAVETDVIGEINVG